MLFSEVAGVGLDELLTFVEKTKSLILNVKRNILLRTMVNDLKRKKNSLSKIKTLKFVFTEDLVPSFNDFDIDIDYNYPETITPVIDELEPIDYVENELEVEYVEEQKSQGMIKEQIPTKQLFR
jgi:hypothetical protein